MRKRQEMTVTVVTNGDPEPADIVRTVLESAGGVTVEEVDGSGVEEVPEPNKKRLVALVAWAAGEDAKRRLGLPNEWLQASYFTRLDEKGEVDYQSIGPGCGTACCIAGKVALEDGGVPDFEGYYSTSLFKFPDGTESYANEYAAEALGLTDDQAGRLFLGSNDLDDLLRMVAKLVGTELVEG